MSTLIIAPLTIVGCLSLAMSDTIEIDVGNTYYDPEFVFVEPGDVIRWIKVGGTHDVTSGESCGNPDGLIDSGIITSTFEWTVPADAASVIEYYCDQGGHCVNGNQFGALLQGNGVIHEISTNGFAFDPPSVTVNPGDTVIWVHGGGSHTVTFGSNCVSDGVLNESLSNLNPLVFWQVPDSAAGTTQDYFCVPHCASGMIASITINGGDDDCPGDSNGDGEINVDDLLNLLGEYGGDCSAGCSSDGDGDGDVDVDDLLDLLNVYGQPC
ncbi:MAG: plastocyanin/azurin family copper-binding protein [Phycisphaerales bacterium]|nr:plastocyanin/azurin family copper-binding protein [Phycisphaerales bacterium]